MLKFDINLCSVVFLLVLANCFAFLEHQKEDCFCHLKGNIDECFCEIDTVDSFNNVRIYPRLRSLLTKDYFRYFKVNLKRKCPFWNDDSKCAMRFCHVQPCQENEIPDGIKSSKPFDSLISNYGPKTLPCNYKETESYYQQYQDKCQCPVTAINGELDCDTKEKLSYLNTTLSPKAVKDIKLWVAYDSAQENFCIIDENDDEAEYVDLLLNPERYTGYKGKSAERVWRSIYTENCFKINSSDPFNYFNSIKLDNMCLEERVFYRAISGLHASINIHLCAEYLLSHPTKISLVKPKGEWGMNVVEFRKRFSPSTTNGHGPYWLRNLYFLYLLELRAIDKAAPLLEKEEFYTGNEKEDWDTKMAIKDLLKVIKQFPNHFDEKSMFIGDANKKNLKKEFREHFRNVSKIMDCVGCEKCKLWGKLQTQGLGTALKILFSGKFDSPQERQHLKLQRNEIVSLINAIGRLSNSIYKLDDFREKLKV